LTITKLAWRDLVPDIDSYQELFAQPDLAKEDEYSLSDTQPRLHYALEQVLSPWATSPFMLLKAPDEAEYLSLLADAMRQLQPESDVVSGGTYCVNGNSVTFSPAIIADGRFAVTGDITTASWVEAEQLFGCLRQFNGEICLQPGLVHQANGGVLLISLRTLLAQPLLWMRLKNIAFLQRFEWVGFDESRPLPVSIPSMPLSLKVALVDLFNRFLFTAKIIFLVVMLALLAPHIHQVNLLTLPLEKGLALSAIPVIFTSFGFHGSVPSIVSYMNGNVRKLRWIFITGSAIPLIAYIFWQLVTLGSINSSTFMGLMVNHSGLNGFLQALREVVASPHVELAVHLFADLALATSFLGVALGLFDYLADLFQRSRSVAGRVQTGAITFLPPLAFALFYPRGFVMALGYAGVALAVLALLLPSMLAWQSRKQHPEGAYRVPGGKPALCLVFACGIGIILVQFCIAAGLLPEVG
jgi:hypothetical protein